MIKTGVLAFRSVLTPNRYLKCPPPPPCYFKCLSPPVIWRFLSTHHTPKERRCIHSALICDRQIMFYRDCFVHAILSQKVPNRWVSMCDRGLVNTNYCGRHVLPPPWQVKALSTAPNSDIIAINSQQQPPQPNGVHASLFAPIAPRYREPKLRIIPETLPLIVGVPNVPCRFQEMSMPIVIIFAKSLNLKKKKKKVPCRMLTLRNGVFTVSNIRVKSPRTSFFPWAWFAGRTCDLIISNK